MRPNFRLFLQTDPFNRAHLTADMLIPDTELKARIEEFMRGDASRGESVQSTKGSLQAPTEDMALIE